MPRVRNIFHNIVTDENSTTELLCNLMSFDEFRIPFLELILPDVDPTEVDWDDIDTQMDHGLFGRPDIQIRNGKVLGLIEVKVTPSLETTVNQPAGYMGYLMKQNEPIRRLVFLVPSKWFNLNRVRLELQTFETLAVQDSGRVRSKIVTWDDVVKMIEVNSLRTESPFIEDFYQLLIGRVAPKPLVFASEEISMLFSNQVPKLLARLQQVVDDIQERGSAFTMRREGSVSLCPSEYGLYFQTPQGKDVFWFGVWTIFWKEHGLPLCFGVNEKWGTKIKEAFLASYRGEAKAFKMGYTVGWIDQETFGRADVVDQIWSIIEPVIQATVAASSIRPEPEGTVPPPPEFGK